MNPLVIQHNRVQPCQSDQIEIIFQSNCCHMVIGSGKVYDSGYDLQDKNYCSGSGCKG